MAKHRNPTAKRLTIENVNLDDEHEMDAFDDQMITAGTARVCAEGDELRRKGLLDRHGNLHGWKTAISAGGPRTGQLYNAGVRGWRHQCHRRCS